ncbi:hypothetical protein NFX46_03970 [Streptomyces phaeoluteigriseus]|uniref:Uncharacterized protein n=1 Tax=Streptomyces phaeoluteigriseus TaxID=114686 RepID=A0ABY4Z1S0_9ACTN|nr:hypothetical protein [Streptomyces phaeoluteigriseus]USQ83003.1 hypothetical protein NFX46_03970 [Streptomyces phaeoluteigriseus]
MNDNDDAGWDERGSNVGRPASDQMRARGDNCGWVSSEWFTEWFTE